MTAKSQSTFYKAIWPVSEMKTMPRQYHILTTSLETKKPDTINFCLQTGIEIGRRIQEAILVFLWNLEMGFKTCDQNLHGVSQITHTHPHWHALKLHKMEGNGRKEKENKKPVKDVLLIRSRRDKVGLAPPWTIMDPNDLDSCQGGEWVLKVMWELRKNSHKRETNHPLFYLLKFQCPPLFAPCTHTTVPH